MKINETHIDSVIRIFASVLLLYVGFSGELAGALAIMAVVLGVDPANLPNFYWKTGSGIYRAR